MTRSGAFRLIAAALALAFLLSADIGDQRRLSVDLWLAAVATWIVVSLARSIVGETSIETPRLRLPIGLAGRSKGPSTPVPRDLQVAEGGVIAATHNLRAFSHRLRPRLRDVAEHRLRLDHGIDIDREPDRARVVLGDAMGLVEPDGLDRPPTADEITDLLHRLEPTDPGAQ